jgi:hypothetical protein
MMVIVGLCTICHSEIGRELVDSFGRASSVGLAFCRARGAPIISHGQFSSRFYAGFSFRYSIANVSTAFFSLARLLRTAFIPELLLSLVM